MYPIRKTLLCLALAHACLVVPGAHPLIEAIRGYYGVEKIMQAREIRFTFNLRILGMGPSHTWIWRPQSDSVTFVDDGVSYSRKSMDAKFTSIDKKFVNDQYWFAFPIHMAYDKGIEIAVDSGLEISPIKEEKLHRIVVSYRRPQGYTPNDAYVLWATPGGEIKEWEYHRGGNMKTGFNWTWENQQVFSGLRFALEHKGWVHVFFTDVSVR